MPVFQGVQLGGFSPPRVEGSWLFVELLKDFDTDSDSDVTETPTTLHNTCKQFYNSTFDVDHK